MELFERYIQSSMGKQPDFKSHRFRVDADIPVVCSYVETLVDKQQIQETLMLPLLEIDFPDGISPKAKLDKIRDIVSAVPFAEESSRDQWINRLMDGCCVLIVGDRGYSLDVAKLKHRQVDEPKSEKIVRGPAEGFTSTLR